MKYKAVFFDLDGTLMDTSEGVLSGGRYAMDKLGLEIQADARWDLFIGPPLGDCFRLTFGISDDKTVEKLCEAYHEYYMETGRFLAKFYPGILEVLKTLKERGYILGITSMKNEDLVQAMCKHFKVDCYFTEQLGIDLTGTMTKADLLKEGFRRQGLKPEECVLIGDTSIDAKGAADAGCACIKANWGFGFKKDEPDSISDPLEILNLV